MTHPLTEIVAQPLQQTAEALAELLSAADIAAVLGPNATRLLGQKPRLVVLRLALTVDALRALCDLPGLDTAESARLRFVAPFLVGAARVLAGALPGYAGLASLRREQALEFFTDYAHDLSPFGGADDTTAWVGLRLARVAVQLTRFSLLDDHRAMLQRLADVVLEQAGPLSGTMPEDEAARQRLRERIAAVVREPRPIHGPASAADTILPTRIGTGRLGLPLACAFTPQGDALAIGTESGGVFVVGWDDGQVRAGCKLANAPRVTDLVFHPEAPWLFIAAEDQSLRLFDCDAGVRCWTKWTRGELEQLLFLPGEPLLLLTDNERGLVIRPTDEKAPGRKAERRVRAFTPRRTGVVARFAADEGGDLLAATEAASTVSGHEDIRLFDRTGTRRATLVGHTDVVAATAFSPWGRLLASAGYDGTVRLWDATTGRQLACWEFGAESRLTCLAFTPDGRHLLVGGGDHTDPAFKTDEPSPLKVVRVVAVATGTVERSLRTLFDVEALTVSRDGRYVAVLSQGDPCVLLWDLRDDSTDLELTEFLSPRIGLPEAEGEEDEEGEEPDELGAVVDLDPLLLAASAGDAAGVELALAAGIDVDATLDGRTALHLAAEGGHTAVVRLLLARGADSQARDTDGHTPRWLALAAGRREAAEVFRQRGETWDDERQLLEAMRDEGIDQVRALLAAGADPDGRAHATVVPPDADEQPHEVATPLTQAAFSGDEPLMELLLDAGADPERRDEVPLSPWGAAMHGGEAGAAALLVLRGASPDPGRSLFEAIRHGNAEAVERLLEAGADVNEPVEQEGGPFTPLEIAVETGRHELALRLLAAGASPDRDEAAAVLRRALDNEDRPRLVRELLKRGLDPNDRDSDGRTPLLVVAREAEKPDAFEVAAVLLAAGADVAARDAKGKTALHLLAAREDGGVELGELLIAHGADPEAQDGKGLTPRQYARKKGNEELAALLASREARRDLPRLLKEPRTGVEYAWRGRVRLATGRWEEALADYEQAIRLDPDRADPGLSDWFTRRSDACDELDNGRPSQALRHYSQGHGSPLLTARIAHYRIADALDPAFWCAANNLAWAAATWPRENMRDGELALRVAQDVERRLPRPVWSPLDTLAAAFAAVGRFGEAVAAAERALELAPEHERPTIQYNLERYRVGLAWRAPDADGEWEEPEPDPWLSPVERLLRAGDYRQALEQAERAPLGGSPTLDMQIDLGRALLAWDRVGEAMPHLERAAGQLERDNEMSLRRVRVLIDLAGARLGRQQLAAATTTCEQALAVAEVALEESHPVRAELLLLRGNLRLAAGDGEAADELLREALAFCADHLPTPHLSTARCLAALAHLARARGRNDDALDLLVDVVEIAEQVLGTRHPRLALTLAAVVEVLLAEGEPVRAIPYARHAYDILERTLGDDHPLTQQRGQILDRCIDLANGVVPEGEEPPA